MTKRVKVFLAFTFTLTWLCWWALAYLLRTGNLTLHSFAGQFLLIAGGSAPTVGAYVAVLATKEAGSLQEFHDRVFKAKLGLRVYAFALLVPVALGIAALGIARLADPAYLNVHLYRGLLVFVPSFFMGIFLGGLEEFGWRGILQPDLVKQASLFRANLAIGVIWALWHLPFFYIPGMSHEGSPFLFFTLAGIGYSAFMTWLYAKTGSVLPCVFFHASINATAVTGLSPAMGHSSAYLWGSVFVFLAGLLLLCFDRR